MKLTLAVLAAVSACGAIPQPIHIESGPVEGIPSAVGGVTAFQGIPYASAPVGKLRWAPPRPAPKWPVVRNADRYMPACPQNYMGPDSTAFFGDYEAKSENCLFLNVWTPAKSAADKLPVMVWIHGGGFRVGSGTERLHHGEHLAAKGVVLVTFNYRLGVFGFLAHPELSKESENHASGNYGLMDQVAALQWVKRNIAAFGGDPDRVMIFGESAGSGSVSLMQASPLAKGLFHAAVGESGGNFSGRNVVHLSTAEETGLKFSKAVGASSIAELRGKATDELIATSVGTASPGAGAYPFTPIVDGYVIPQDVYLIFSKGAQNKVPVLVGSNSDEGTTLRTPPPSFEDPSVQQDLKTLYPAGSEPKIVSGGMLWTSYTWAALQTKTGGTRAYQYYFSHAPPFPKGQPFARDVSKLGAHHSAEIIYVFNNLGIRATRDWPYTAYDRKLADIISSYWVNFAKTGNPNGQGLPVWPVWAEADTRVMEFGDTVQAVPLPRRQEVEFWDRVNLKPYQRKSE